MVVETRWLALPVLPLARKHRRFYTTLALWGSIVMAMFLIGPAIQAVTGSLGITDSNVGLQVLQACNVTQPPLRQQGPAAQQ